MNLGTELLHSITHNIPFQEYLNIISSVLSADRSYIFLNHTGSSGEILMSHIAEWCRDGIESEIDNHELQNLSYDKFFSRWFDILSDGQIIFGKIKKFPVKEKYFLEKRGIKSIIVVPLISGGEFVGFIGFDKCSCSDEWSESDLEFIKASSHILSHRIEQNWVLSRLQSENKLFTTVMDPMDVIIYAVDYDTFEVVYMNKYAIAKFGDCIGLKCWNAFNEGKSMPCSFCSKKWLIADDGSFNKPYIWEHYFPKIDQWCMCSSQAMEWTDGKTVIFQISTDITKQKNTAALLEKSIEEKDTLLNEVHHRVKNNLQSLIYLISMQADSVDSSKAVKILNELRDRVQAMSLVHSQLYESKNLANINFENYVSELIKTLFRAIATDKIKTCINISDIILDIKIAIPCALILNELVTNIIKHAFKGKRNLGVKPEIRISMEKVNDDYVLKVGDNGKGVKMQDDLNNPKSIGLKLINIWATHQLRGTIDKNEDLGVEYIITFPQE